MIQSYVGYPLDLRSPPEAGKDGEPKKVHTGKYSFTAHFPDVDDDFSAGCWPLSNLTDSGAIFVVPARKQSRLRTFYGDDRRRFLTVRIIIMMIVAVVGGEWFPTWESEVSNGWRVP